MKRKRAQTQLEQASNLRNNNNDGQELAAAELKVSPKVCEPVSVSLCELLGESSLHTNIGTPSKQVFVRLLCNVTISSR